MTSLQPQKDSIDHKMTSLNPQNDNLSHKMTKLDPQNKIFNQQNDSCTATKKLGNFMGEGEMGKNCVKILVLSGLSCLLSLFGLLGLSCD